MTTDDPFLLSGAYVLGALTDDETAAFERELARNEQLRIEVTELTDTSVLLGLSVEPVAPPASLKASIFDALDALPASEDEPHERAVGPEPTVREHLAPVIELRWFQKPAAVVLGAAATVAIIAGAISGGAHLASDHLESVEASRYSQIAATDDAKTASADVAGGGTATLVWSEKDQAAALRLDGVRAPDAGSVYQLWYIDANGPRSAGTVYTADGDTWVTMSGEIDPGDTVGITVEPTGGSPQPTTDPVVAIATA